VAVSAVFLDVGGTRADGTDYSLFGLAGIGSLDELLP
jgi:hypothetical protein